MWISWRLDETYIRVKGEWRYLYRAVDKYGQTIDFLLTEQRDEQAARRFLTKAIRRHGVPEKITIDGSEANAAAIRGYNEAHGTAIIIRQVKYLNNIVEQDHRAVKRVTRPMLGFKSFEAAQVHPGRGRAHAHAQETAVGGRGGRRGPHGGRTVLLRWPPNHPTDRVQLTSNRLHTKICDRALYTPARSGPVFRCTGILGHRGRRSSLTREESSWHPASGPHRFPGSSVGPTPAVIAPRQGPPYMWRCGGPIHWVSKCDPSSPDGVCKCVSVGLPFGETIIRKALPIAEKPLWSNVILRNHPERLGPTHSRS